MQNVNYRDINLVYKGAYDDVFGVNPNSAYWTHERLTNENPQNVLVQLAEDYKGRNPAQTSLLLSNMLEGSETSLFPRMTRDEAMSRYPSMIVNGTNIFYNTWEFHETGLESQAHGMPGLLNVAVENTKQDRMAYYGNGFQVPLDFMNNKLKMNAWGRFMSQLFANVNMTWDQCTRAKVFQEARVAYDNRIQPMGHRQFVAFLNRREKSTFALQREASGGTGWNGLESQARRIMSMRQGRQPDTVIVPCGSVRYQQLLETKNTNSIEGKGGRPDSMTYERKGLKTDLSGLQIRESFPYPRGRRGEMFDPSRSIRNVGQRWEMLPNLHCRPEVDNYRTWHRDTEVIDVDKGEWKRITLKSAFLNSGLLDESKKKFSEFGYKILADMVGKDKGHLQNVDSNDELNMSIHDFYVASCGEYADDLVRFLEDKYKTHPNVVCNLLGMEEIDDDEEKSEQPKKTNTKRKKATKKKKKQTTDVQPLVSGIEKVTSLATFDYGETFQWFQQSQMDGSKKQTSLMFNNTFEQFLFKIKDSFAKEISNKITLEKDQAIQTKINFKLDGTKLEPLRKIIRFWFLWLKTLENATPTDITSIIDMILLGSYMDINIFDAPSEETKKNSLEAARLALLRDFPGTNLEPVMEWINKGELLPLVPGHLATSINVKTTRHRRQTIEAQLKNSNLTVKFLKDCLRDDIPFPISFMLNQPHGAIESSSMLFLKRGPETGLLLVDDASVNLNPDTQTKTMTVHADFTAGCTIRDRKNLELIPDVSACRYLGHLGTKLFPYTRDAIESYRQREEIMYDIFVQAIRYNEKPNHFFSYLSEEEDHRLYRRDDHTDANKTTLSTTKAYAQELNWTIDESEPHMFAQNGGSQYANNVFVVKGAQKVHDSSNASGRLTLYIEGKNCFGAKPELSDLHHIMSGGGEGGQEYEGRGQFTRLSHR